jgi:hypothetical protein
MLNFETSVGKGRVFTSQRLQILEKSRALAMILFDFV